MLVKYNSNADKNEATGAITGLEAGHDIPLGQVGEINDLEYGVLSTRVNLEVVGDGWDVLSTEDLEANAARLGVVLEGLSTKDEYVKAIKDRRTSPDEEEAPTEPVPPVTATSSGVTAPVGGGAAGSSAPGSAGAGGGRS